MLQEEFFVQIKSRIKNGIDNKRIEIDKIKKIIINSAKPEIFNEFTRIYENLSFYKGLEKLERFSNLFIVARNYLKSINQKNEISLESEEFTSSFVDVFVQLLISERFCSECNSTNVENSFFPITENHVIYYCINCQKNVKIYQKSQHLPLFLAYLKEWENTTREDPDTNKKKAFVEQLFLNCFEYFKVNGNLNSIILFYVFLTKNGVNVPSLSDREDFKKFLLKALVKALERIDFFDFIEGKTFYNNEFGDIKEDIQGFNELVLKVVIESLKSGLFFKVNYAIEHFLQEKYIDMQELCSDPKIVIQIERNFYEGLAKCVEMGQFDNFKNLLDYSSKFDLFIDVKKIPRRYDSISNLLMNCVQTLDLGEIIEVLKHANAFNLFEKASFTDEEKAIISSVRSNTVFIENLKDLFGSVSNSFILFVKNHMARDLYDLFARSQNDDFFYFRDYNIEQIVDSVLMYPNNYSIYGLSVSMVGTVKRFISAYKIVYEGEKKKLRQQKTAINAEDDIKLVKIQLREKTHLVSPTNIRKNLHNILAKNDYHFYNLSMVLTGGIGPQGQGFTYSTPRGELVEICSDAKENQSIIVKFKQFLKQQFIAKLGGELNCIQINATIVQKVLSFLSEILDNRELVDYYKKEPILHKISSFLLEDENFRRFTEPEREDLMNKINDAVTIILRPITMVDQFKCRMDLVAEDKIKSEDIAKLTSLKEKSHYDILRERTFFQQVIDWFYEIYKVRKTELSGKS